MNQTAAFPILLGVLIAVGPARGGVSQEPPWKGKTELKGGVTVVSNPDKPLYGSDALRLEEESSFGETEGSEESALHRAWDVAVGDDGTIYVMDAGDSCVKVFDKNGRYERRIGRKGQGPGEVQNPNSVHLLAGGRLVFEDFIRGLNTYAADGRFLDSLATVRIMPVGLLVTPDFRIVAYVNSQDPARKGKEIRVYDEKLSLLKTLSFMPEETPDPRVIKPFAPRFQMALSPGGRLIVCPSDAYEIEVYDLEKGLSRLIRRTCERVKITKEEIEAMAKYARGRKMDVPETHPAIQGLSSDEEGRIFVETFERTQDRKSFIYDVFDRDGRYLARIPISGTATALVWKDSRLTDLEEDADGFQKVKRYRVRWQIPN